MENIGTLKQQTQNGSLQYNPLILKSVPIAAQFNRHLYFGLCPLYKCLDVRSLLLMNPHIDVCIQNGSRMDRQYLVDRVRDPKLGRNANVVYIYALVDETVNYPNKPGHVIYIGEAGRPTEPTGKRFGQHISREANTGGDSGTIYALSRYYWLGKPIRLQILLVESKEERKKQERCLLNAHVKEYGALPICQGTTGENYKTSVLTTLSVNPGHLALFVPSSNISLQGTLRDKVAQRP